MHIQRGAMCASRPEPIEVVRDVRGARVAMLRKNIVHDWADKPDGEGSVEFYRYDECITETDMREEDIAERFDDLWYAAERGGMTETEWRADIDAALLDLMEMAVG